MCYLRFLNVKIITEFLSFIFISVIVIVIDFSKFLSSWMFESFFTLVIVIVIDSGQYPSSSSLEFQTVVNCYHLFRGYFVFIIVDKKTLV